MHGANQTTLDTLQQQPGRFDTQADMMTALRHHLVFPLNKYERVFGANPAM